MFHLPLLVRTHFKLGHAFLLGITILRIGHAKHLQRPRALHRLPVQRARGRGDDGFFTRQKIAAVQPNVHFKRTTRRDHLAAPKNRSPREIRHLRGDAVFVVLIAVQFLGDRRVDLDRHRAIDADLRLALGHQFRRRTAPRLPWGRHEAFAPPTRPRIPIVRGVSPTVTRTEQPVPAPHRPPAIVMPGALNLVLHGSFLHRAAEVVVRLHLHLEALAQQHRLGRCLDLHLELRLLVFLDPEALPTEMLIAPDHPVPPQRDLVVPQRRFFRKMQFPAHAAPLIRFDVRLDQLFTPGIGHGCGDRFSRHRVQSLIRIIARHPQPRLPLHRLVWAIHRAIRHHVGSRAQRSTKARSSTAMTPEAAESKERHAPRIIRPLQQPLIALVQPPV